MKLTKDDFEQFSVNNIEQYSTNIDDIVEDIVKKYCDELDKFIVYINDVIEDTSKPISDGELEDFILTLPCRMYIVASAIETIGIREDVARQVERVKYNNEFESFEGTVASKKAIAELNTNTETLSKVVYSRAYKAIKGKYDTAMEVLQSAKKIYSKRMLDIELSKSDRAYNRKENI